MTGADGCNFNGKDGVGKLKSNNSYQISANPHRAQEGMNANS